MRRSSTAGGNAAGARVNAPPACLTVTEPDYGGRLPHFFFQWLAKSAVAFAPFG